MPSKRPYYYKEPAFVQKFLDAERAGKLSTKDRQFLNKMRAGVSLTPAEEASNMATELSSANLRSITDAIASEKDPAIIQILKQEHNNILGLRAAADKIRQEQAAQAQQEQGTSFLDGVKNLLQSIFSSPSKGN